MECICAEQSIRTALARFTTFDTDSVFSIHKTNAQTELTTFKPVPLAPYADRSLATGRALTMTGVDAVKTAMEVQEEASSKESAESGKTDNRKQSILQHAALLPILTFIRDSPDLEQVPLPPPDLIDFERIKTVPPPS